ncbi:hypothetical protein ACL6C3_13630 [Capilliphycus salinus ALCB114379]|uniref:hypothetical protein n=1 Tax=Capilliphycus salinus TaxID=2768948 RepID=UPI0039A494D1
MVRSDRTETQFANLWQEYRDEGYRLVDFEHYPTANGDRYAGVWAENTAPNNSSNPPRPNPDSPDPDSFPTLPAYIKLTSGTLGSQNYRILVDFSRTIEGQPEITLPTQFLPQLPTYDGEVLFPDNFCGLQVMRASRFLWLDTANNVVDEHPYNFIPESQSLKDIENGETFYLGGINFTGPIGACNDGSGTWSFPFPLTKEGKNPFANLKLVIELEGDSKIEFLNYNFSKQPLKADKIFKEISLDKILKQLQEQFDDSNSKKRLENFEDFVEEVCEASPEKCPYFP